MPPWNQETGCLARGDAWDVWCVWYPDAVIRRFEFCQYRSRLSKHIHLTLFLSGPKTDLSEVLLWADESSSKTLLIAFSKERLSGLFSACEAQGEVR
jgi:hypothetical protein